MRLILRGDKLSAKKYIGFAKARLNDMKNIMNALGLNYNRKYYKLPDADMVVESNRLGLDSAWIVGRGIVIGRTLVLPDSLDIIANLLSPNINISIVDCFTSDITSGSAPLTVQFTDTSDGTPTVWVWDFGDGFQSTDQNPIHTYTATGPYTVSFKSFTSSTTTRNGSNSTFEARTSGAGHASNAIAHAAFIADDWDPATGIQVARYTIFGEAGGSTFQYGANNSNLTVDLSLHLPPKIAILELLWNNMTLAESTVLLGTGVKLNAEDNGWFPAADITAELGTNFVTSITDDSFPQLTTPAQSMTNGWQITDARAIIHTPISAVDECTGIDFITVT